MDARDWDERYAGADLVWRDEPNRFVAEEVSGLAPGAALDLACGEGRNAVWLAEQGWAATGVDFSSAGLAKGARLAVDRGVSVEWVEADVTTWAAPMAAFDLVVVCYLQLGAVGRRAALTRAVGALAVGGTLIVVAHDRRNLDEGAGGPQDPAVLYTPEDVLGDLATTGVPVLVRKAATVERTVDAAARPALDCLVRVEREGD